MTGQDMTTKEGVLTLSVFIILMGIILASFEDRLSQCDAFPHHEYSACN